MYRVKRFPLILHVFDSVETARIRVASGGFTLHEEANFRSPILMHRRFGHGGLDAKIQFHA
jgi:hypothetical protein